MCMKSVPIDNRLLIFLLCLAVMFVLIKSPAIYIVFCFFYYCGKIFPEFAVTATHKYCHMRLRLKLRNWYVSHLHTCAVHNALYPTFCLVSCVYSHMCAFNVYTTEIRVLRSWVASWINLRWEWSVKEMRVNRKRDETADVKDNMDANAHCVIQNIKRSRALMMP